MRAILHAAIFACLPMARNSFVTLSRGRVCRRVVLLMDVFCRSAPAIRCRAAERRGAASPCTRGTTASYGKPT